MNLQVKVNTNLCYKLTSGSSWWQILLHIAFYNLLINIGLILFLLNFSNETRNVNYVKNFVNLSDQKKLVIRQVYQELAANWKECLRILPVSFV